MSYDDHNLTDLRRAGVLAGIGLLQAGTTLDDLALPDDLIELALEAGLDLTERAQTGEFTLGVRKALAMTMLPERVTIRGSLPSGAPVEGRSKRVRESVAIAVNLRHRMAVTYTGDVVSFDNIWVCDQPALFGEPAPVPVFAS